MQLEDLKASKKRNYDLLLLTIENNVLTFLNSLIEGKIMQTADQKNQLALMSGTDANVIGVVDKIINSIDVEVYIENMDNYAKSNKVSQFGSLLGEATAIFGDTSKYLNIAGQVLLKKELISSKKENEIPLDTKENLFLYF